MIDVPIILVLSTPCSHMAYHFKVEMTIEYCINLSLDDRGLVKKNIFPIYEKLFKRALKKKLLSLKDI